MSCRCWGNFLGLYTYGKPRQIWLYSPPVRVSPIEQQSYACWLQATSVFHNKEQCDMYPSQHPLTIQKKHRYTFATNFPHTGLEAHKSAPSERHEDGRGRPRATAITIRVTEIPLPLAFPVFNTFVPHWRTSCLYTINTRFPVGKCHGECALDKRQS